MLTIPDQLNITDTVDAIMRGCVTGTRRARYIVLFGKGFGPLYSISLHKQALVFIVVLQGSYQYDLVQLPDVIL